MDKNRIFTGISAWLLSAAISFAGMGCVITAFGFEQVNMAWLLLFSLGAGLYWSVTSQFSIGGMLGWILAGAAVCLDWLSGGKGLLEFRNSLEVLLHTVSTAYNEGYGWGVVQWSETLPDTGPETALCVASFFITFAISWTVSKRQPAFFAVFMGFTPLLVCTVLADTVPAVPWLILLILAMGLLMLTNSLRRRDEQESNRLIAWLLLPVMLATCLLFHAIPQEEYQPLSDSYLGFFEQWGQGNGELIEGGNAVYLDQLGAKSESYHTALWLKTKYTGRLYLRGQSYDRYDGRTWQVSAGIGADNGWGIPQLSHGEVNIRTAQPMDYFLVPTPPGKEYALQFQDGRYPNQGRGKSYTLIWYEKASGGKLTEDERLLYTQLPERTRDALADFLKDHVLPENVTERAEFLGRLVRRSASYSLEPSEKPADEGDFALWFLQEADRGYCAHFASTATVLLRAAGIPARYVSGYVADASSRLEIAVPENQAHAWVEYFDDATGWTVLDPTPGYGTVSTPDHTTEPTTTNPEPTQPIETTQPTTETTAPTQGTSQSPSQESQSNTTGEGPGAAPREQLDLTAFFWVLWLVAGIVVIWGQYRLRRQWYRRYLSGGKPNERALCLWRTLVRRSKILGCEIPSRTKELAEKAKFSQHRITKEELQEMETALVALSEQVKQKPWYIQWAIRLLFAI